MKNYRTPFLLLLTLSAFIWAGCSATDSNNIERKPLISLKAKAPTTNIDRETPWNVGDKIGVSVIDANGGVFMNNIPFVTLDGEEIFTPVSEGSAQMPLNSTIDLRAYYPFQENVSQTVTVDASNGQNSFFTGTASRFNTANEQPQVNFNTLLAQININLRGDDKNVLAACQVRLKDINSKAEFDLNSFEFKDIREAADISTKQNGSRFTAYVIPQTLQNLQAVITLPAGNDSVVDLIALQRVGSGKSYTHSVEIDAARHPINYQGWLETPLITNEQKASTTMRYVTHYFKDGTRTVRNYSMLYDTNLKMAYWVAYPLCNYYTRGSIGRTEKWDYDPEISTEEQACLYKGMSNGYDRGHQIPSADRQSNYEANCQTFYFTNMTPQVGKGMNQDIWAYLETAVRGWSSNLDTLYVVTGAMPTTKENSTVDPAIDNAGNRIAIPKYYFKALCHVNRTTGEARTIAFKLNNERYSHNNYMTCAMSVKELEELTGFTFFPEIDEQYKASYDASYWPSTY